MSDHVSPVSLYVTIFFALMILTGVTVAAAFVNLGQFNFAVAMAIAGFKASLVVWYFMHVKYQSHLTKLTVATGLFFLATVGLKDCPPGANSIRGLTKPGEEFAIVNLSFKVTPAFKETIVKKPVLLDASGKVFNTAMSFIDPGATPEYSCGFAYRVPDGTKLGKLQIDTTTIDLTAFDKK